MMNQLNGLQITRCLNGVAAGTTDQNGSAVDMQGYEGVIFIALLGALTASQVTELKAQQSADSGGSPDDFSDIAGSKVGPLADGDGNKMLVLEIVNPQKRYVRPVLLRETANAAAQANDVARATSQVSRPQKSGKATMLASSRMVA